MTNDKQQTTLEWFAFELSKLGLLPDGVPDDIYKQAKEMEKEQKADTWNNAINAVEKDKWDSFEQFYEQTYEGNK
jgi:hypothetical protein